ncbi:SIR2 family protein [Streptomyces sp. NBC_00391]|uniref:SIR2 family protein n=1 Tax=Streptomyces sp. NBC_00391 TaxID=2903647 RepID=UPI002E1D91F9
MGSGLSISMGMPPWGKLLAAVDRSSIPPTQRAIISKHLDEPGAEYQASEELADALGHEILRSQLCHIVKQEQAKITEVTKWFSALEKIDPTGIVTTNWDTLLHEFHAEMHSFSWPNCSEEILAAMRDGQLYTLHLHGSTEDGNIAITPQDCKAVAQKLSQNSRLLRSVMACSYMLVIGYGFPDPHVRQLLEQIIRLAGSDQLAYVVRKENSPGRDSVPRRAKVLTFSNYEEFQEALNTLSAKFDPSVKLNLLSEVEGIDDFLEIMSPQMYNYDTLSEACYSLEENAHLGRILNEVAQVLPEGMNDPRTEGVLATVLSKMPRAWEADHKTALHLEEFFDKTVKKVGVAQVALVEPLSAALAQQGYPRTHHEYLKLAIDSDAWRNADRDRVSYYYGKNTAKQIGAIRRRLRDKRRKGVLLATDVTRMLNMLESDYFDTKELVLSMVEKAANAFAESGDGDTADKVRHKVGQIMKEKERNARRGIIGWKGVGE